MSSRKAKLAEAAAIRDKWRAKTWYTITAPEYFKEIEIGTTPASNASNLKERIITTSMYDITDRFNLMHVNVKFAIDKVKGSRASTSFVGHELTRDYIRSLVRRGTSRIQSVVDVTTKDDFVFRTTTVVFTHSRVRTSLQKEIRKIITKTMLKRVARHSYEGFAKNVVSGDIADSIGDEVSKIVPVRKVEVLKSKLRQKPKIKKKPK
jgi:small subunit ribosomal protein S3Ae